MPPVPGRQHTDHGAPTTNERVYRLVLSAGFFACAVRLAWLFVLGP